MDIFERIEALNKRGIIISCVAVNQIENGYDEQVRDRTIPLVTYTVEVMNSTMDEMLYTESCDTFRDAIIAGVEYAEKRLLKR